MTRWKALSVPILFVSEMTSLISQPRNLNSAHSRKTLPASTAVDSIVLDPRPFLTVGSGVLIGDPKFLGRNHMCLNKCWVGLVFVPECDDDANSKGLRCWEYVVGRLLGHLRVWTPRQLL